MLSYDGLLLSAVTREIKNALTGGRITKIRQHNQTDVTLEVRVQGANGLLFMSADAQFPRIYLSSSNPPVPQTPPNFCMVLRKYVQGSFVKLIHQVGFDRIVEIHTEAPDGNEYMLILEIMGKHSNLILVNGAGEILGAAKMIGSSASRYRQVLPHRQYIPPPGDKKNFLEIDRNGIESLWNEYFRDKQENETSAEKWLTTTFSGFGSFLAREIVQRASEPAIDEIAQELEFLKEIIRTGNYSPIIHTDSAGLIDFVYPIPSVQLSGRQHPRGQVSEALDAYFRTAIPNFRLNQLREQFAGDIRKAMQAREAALSMMQEAINSSGQSEKAQKMGEMILANLHLIKGGEDSVEVVDYYDPEMAKIKIPLDRKLSPKENAEAYFRKARKLREGALSATKRIDEMRKELLLLKGAEQKLESLRSEEELSALKQFLVDHRALRPSSAPGEPRQQEALYPGYRIKRIVSVDGYEILLGENSESNDYLTTRIAKPDDVWLHARQIKGAHVVIRGVVKGVQVPASTLKQAAALAAANSDAKHSRLVPVDYTLRKYVRKPRGASPGFVIYTHEKTIDIMPDEGE